MSTEVIRSGSEASKMSTAMPISDAMLSNAPSDPDLRKHFMIGACAATYRRQHPIATPLEVEFDLDIPNDDDGLMSKGIDIEEMPYLASPSIELIRQYAPDLVMGADRGGRILGLAVFTGWHQRYPQTRFPTIDGKLHFGHISKNADYETNGSAIERILNCSGIMAELSQREADKSEEPVRILFLDDWVHQGATVDLVRTVISEKIRNVSATAEFELLLGTMRGTMLPSSVHAVGDTRRDGKGIWTDDSRYTGVDYDYGQTIPGVVRSEAAYGLRVQLHQAVKEQLAVADSSQDQHHLVPSWIGSILGRK